MADKENKVVETEAKAEKPAKKEKKPSRIKEAWRGFKSEIKKIVWPSWKQVLKNTGVVLVIVIVFAIAIALLDYAFSGGIRALVDLVPKGE
ncbi:MAG: preprotein translocase subunit SecE [Clostridia bacterium]|nr:preprotein translocase subunit SecE [Clostridia bacterium]